MSKQRSPAELRELLKELPPSLRVYTAPSVTCDVYCAKNMFCDQWNNTILHTLTIDARGSYKRYGNVPLSDKYDSKSAIYLVRARYEIFFAATQQFLPIEEWLSMRFIPAEGVPKGTSDFDECVCIDGSLAEEMRTKLFNGASDFVKHIVTISRICGIHPYLGDNSSYSGVLSKRHRYTALCFALMNQQFLSDGHDKIFYMTGLFRDELIEKALTIQTSTMERLPSFTDAHEVLDYSTSQKIRLKREKSAYFFPGYFLKVDQLFTVLMDCLQSGKISLELLQQYLPIANEAELVAITHEGGFKSRYLHQLEKLLSHKGPLGTDKTFDGVALRRAFDLHVKDGPQLKIMEVEKWQKSIARFFLFGQHIFARKDMLNT